VLDFIEILSKKSCDGCTKCCEGYLTANIKGHSMSLGNPCPFVIKDVGCGEYATRPQNPCVAFECEWRRNPYFEEWLSPNNSNVIFTRQVKGKFEFLNISEAGRPLEQKVIDWAVSYAEKNKLNLAWSVENVNYVVGSNEFIEMMKNDHINHTHNNF